MRVAVTMSSNYRQINFINVGTLKHTTQPVPTKQQHGRLLVYLRYLHGLKLIASYVGHAVLRFVTQRGALCDKQGEEFGKSL